MGRSARAPAGSAPAVPAVVRGTASETNRDINLLTIKYNLERIRQPGVISSERVSICRIRCGKAGLEAPGLSRALGRASGAGAVAAIPARLSDSTSVREL